jgi:hypothetical protein
MPQDRFITHAERCRRVEAFLKANQWSWFRLAKEMDCDYMTVKRNFAPSKRVRNDPRISLIRALARATGTTAGFWLDRGNKNV